MAADKTTYRIEQRRVSVFGGEWCVCGDETFASLAEAEARARQFKRFDPVDSMGNSVEYRAAEAKEKPATYAIARGATWLNYDDRGRVIWGQWADTTMTLSEAKRVVATYAPSTQLSLRIVPA